MKNDIVTLDVAADLPIGTVFKYSGSRQKYRVEKEKDDEKWCDNCVFKIEGWAHENKENKSKYFKCKALCCYPADRKDKTKVTIVKE